jgi:NAD(P)-dependent dehydrogenase (short-subunit alcohol dehydrogenase family)
MIGYVASKHAVLGLTKTAAIEAGQYGVRVNAICPGAVDTDMMHRIGEMRKAGKAPTWEVLGMLTPTRRNNTPDDIADIVLFLCSDAIGNINGIHHDRWWPTLRIGPVDRRAGDLMSATGAFVRPLPPSVWKHDHCLCLIEFEA